MSESRFDKSAAADLAEASLEDQRAALMRQAEALGLVVLAPDRPVRGPVRVQLDGHGLDVAEAVDVLAERGIHLDDLSAPRETSWGARCTAVIDLHRRGPSAPPVVDDQPSEGGEVRLRLRGTPTDIEIVLTILRETMPVERVSVIDMDRNRVTGRQYLTVDTVAAARAHTARVVHSADNDTTTGDVVAAVIPDDVPIDRDLARQLARHAKAVLLHFHMVEDLAERAGLDVNGRTPGSVGAFLHDVDHMVEALDGWAINTAGRSGGLTRQNGVYANVENWCHKPGGMLPVDETGREGK
ncbi:hypothetical protein [Nonomuraea sp. NEAU-A123]|uniref:hypothetical protein n=1 Tax=Nonomuraea sp. NEAU-A123 TaxID=2839649 RepID=UPI001BE4DC68|nr:hypothetical protein [Nonomuraea sp. NEAU-A123]MBT2226250.1 hypothetical protein [Nonomuraea sp. NEAU-A123]